ncbi:LADA_0D00276g1_1 [Lachancea dasiensis]|uniref:LADA_0D00276g1_1 n=1 Tax=Lachancea dasiensis TaxID=1072105 RepID=A0A1G4J3B5_9SACH|nr:LADA_0D00276g1_1 [Lachancea dasiensis]
MAVSKRVYVGNVVHEHDDSLFELKPRFERFGRCLSDQFESHGHFAYMNMEFEDEARFAKLKQSLNGVRFKGNKLKIDQAKLSWQDRWESERELEGQLEEAKQKQLLKQQWEHNKKIQNIQMSWMDRQQILRGRMRTAPRNRAQLRNVTFRVLCDGRLKVYKSYKNKLWGYERHKQPRDLTARFTDSRYWRDGNDHIVDKLDYSHSSLWGTRQGSEKTQGTTATFVTEDLEGAVDKTRDVLADLLGDYDFEKPIALEDNDDENASSDYEYTALYRDQEAEQKPSSKSSEAEVPKHVKASNGQEIVEQEVEQDSDDEFIPTFGAQPETPAVTNPTEELRSLLNPDENDTTSFKLTNISNEDIDESKVAPEVHDTETTTYDLERPSTDSDRGLFFPHFSSPFLHSQSQLAKLKSSKDQASLYADWESNFWENRAAWTQEMKRKKRDALRQYRKKNSRSRGEGILL